MRYRPWSQLFTIALAAMVTAPESSSQQPATAPETPAPKSSKPKPSRSRGRVTVIRAGTVHPVSGPAIQNGVVVIRSRRIEAVGPASSVEIPEGAKVLDYPEGHVYPGLVDALSTAFLSAQDLQDRSTTAGTRILDGLDRYDRASGELIRHGVTTAYVSARPDSTWRGIGTVLRLRDGSFRSLGSKKDAAVQLRMTTGPGNLHPLTRNKQLASIDKPFDALDKYEKSFEEHKKKRKQYDEDFEKYLEYHRAKQAKKQPKPDTDKAGDKPAAKEGEKTGGDPADKARRSGRRSRRAKPDGKTTTDGKTDAKKPDAKKPDAKKSDAKKPDAAPKRPKFPKPPKRDPAKDALLRVKQGELPLRVEARRIDEIRAALSMAEAREIGQLVLEQATAAAEIAAEIAAAGAAVIITEVSPAPNSPYSDKQDGSLAGDLQRAGVSVAIASGSVAQGHHLPMLAAIACGHGLDTDAALRAITLTPAEILGIQSRVGSLEPGKIADLIVTTGPILHSDSHILRVITDGRTRWEDR